MDRAIPFAFGLLGVLAGVISRLQSMLPSLIPNASVRSIQVPFLLFSSIVFAISTLAVAALGYWANRRVSLPDEYARFGLVAGVAGGFGFLLGTVAVLVATLPVSIADAPLLAVTSVSYSAVTKGVSIGLFGLAGAAVAHFREGAAHEKRSADA